MINQSLPLKAVELRKFDYEQVPTPCCKVGTSGLATIIITECNQLLAELLLSSSGRNDIIGTSLLELVDPKCHSDVLAVISSMSSSESNQIVKQQLSAIGVHGKDSTETFPCALYFMAVRDYNNNNNNISSKATSINISFIDERKYTALVDQMQRDKDRLAREEKLKDEFIAVASHELKTPIQPILGFAMLARKGLVSQEKAWDSVLYEARRLQQLASDILDVSRIESGSIKFNFEKDKINTLLRSLADSLRQDMPMETSLEVNYDESEADVEIELDRSRISQVVSNLISNAIKFTPSGSIRVQSKAYPERNEFEIKVADTGKGLAPEILPRLFEKFATKGHGDVQNKKGSGLGLYISKAIIEGHKGKISASNNNEGPGATFLIRLPISQAQA